MLVKLSSNIPKTKELEKVSAMADDVDVDRPDQKCEICEGTIKKSTAKSRCCGEKCSVIMHKKCFEKITKIFAINKSNWRCCKCNEASATSTESTSESSVHKFYEVKFEGLERENHLLSNLVEELKCSNTLLKEKVKAVTEKPVSFFNSSVNQAIPQTYSSAVKNANNSVRKQKSSMLIIKSTTQNTNVMEELQSHVNPASLNVRINNTKPIKGGLLINCENSDSLSKLKEAVINKFGDKFVVDEPKKLNPRIIITNVDKKVTTSNKEFIEDIILNNPQIKDTELKAPNQEIKVITRLNRKFSQSIVLEVTPNIRSKVISQGFLYIRWQRCPVEDNYNVVRCYRCSRYGHVQKDCKFSNPTCSTCAGSHETRDCDNLDNKKCINCLNCNERNKRGNSSNLAINHSASDYKLCASYHHQIDILKSKINNGE